MKTTFITVALALAGLASIFNAVTASPLPTNELTATPANTDVAANGGNIHFYHEANWEAGPLYVDTINAQENTCYDTHLQGISSVKIDWDANCILYEKPSCDGSGHVTAISTPGSKNLADVGLNDMLHSFWCFAPSKARRSEVTFYRSLKAREARVLGVAIDVCRDGDYGNCELNQRFDGLVCYNLDMNAFQNGISSIRMYGGSQCTLFVASDCVGDIKVIRGSTPSLGNFNHRTQSLICFRSNKERTGSTDVATSELTIAMAGIR